jgi:hypothetical protein
MWDLAEDKSSINLIESFLAAGKFVALVCHAPGVPRHVKTPGGKPLVDGKNVTGFTDGEEEEVALTKVVPFLVEDELMGLGAIFSKVKKLGRSHGQGRPIDYRPEPGLVRPGCQTADRDSEQEGEIARPLQARPPACEQNDGLTNP